MQFSLIAGARPNFIKIGPIIKSIEQAKSKGMDIDYRLVHTGQHYDHKMSHTFFEELNIPQPHVNLGAGGGTQAEQTAAIMLAFEKDLSANPTDLVMVVGDVTSTLACSIVAKKMNVPVAHVEAGIRSFDQSMPEEINRMVTDSITDYFFTTSKLANENLLKAGVEANRIFFVGNVMIDTLLSNRHRFKKPQFFDKLGLKETQYLVLTLHRPANVDDPLKLESLLNEIVLNSHGLPVIFPVHPRTAKMIRSIHASNPVDSVISKFPGLHLLDPLGYLEFNYLVERAKAVITDSGGITEETTVMQVPCITLRNNTERPETCTVGTNELIGTDPQNIRPALDKLFEGKWKKGGIPELWDGQTAGRIVEVLNNMLIKA